jgi:hypothetical protein
MPLGVIGLHPLHSPPFVKMCFTLKHIFGLMGLTFCRKPNVRVATNIVYNITIVILCCAIVLFQYFATTIYVKLFKVTYISNGVMIFVCFVMGINNWIHNNCFIRLMDSRALS